MVAVGSFVQTEDSSIGKILDHRTSANADQEVLLNLFILMSESSIRYRTQPVASGRGRHVREVIQSLIKTWVPANSCRRPAFIFTNSDLENGKFMCGDGMQDSFLLRFRCDLGAPTAHLPFPDLHDNYPVTEKSFSLCIFEALQRLLDTTSLLLNRQAELQGDF